jgi:hypothetical protein
MCPAFAGDAKRHPLQVALNGTAATPVDETPYGLGRDRDGVRSVPADPGRSIWYVTVRIEPDAWIKPERSALLDGAGGIGVAMPDGVRAIETSAGNYRLLERTDHDSLLSNPSLLRLVSMLLTARDAVEAAPSGESVPVPEAH